MTGKSMEKERDRYSLHDLALRWKRYPVSCDIKDLLKLGAEGLIQFSVLKDDLPNIKSIVSSWHYYSGGTLIECTYFSKIGSAKYIKLSKESLANLAANTEDKVIVDMYPWCPHCPLGRHPTNCLVEYKIEYEAHFLEALETEEIENLPDWTTCSIEDLVVTHDEVTRFEESFEKVLNPPYLDSGHPYYCYELATAVETWREIFEFQKVTLKSNLKRTVWEYIPIRDKDLDGSYDGGTGSRGRITAMLNQVHDKVFDELKKQRE